MAPKQDKVRAIFCTVSSESPVARAMSSSERTPSKSIGTRISARSVTASAVISAALVELSSRKTFRSAPSRATTLSAA